MRISELKLPDGMELVIVVRPGYDHITAHLQVQPEKGDVQLHTAVEIGLSRFDEVASQEKFLQLIINKMWSQLQEEIRLMRYDPAIRPPSVR